MPIPMPTSIRKTTNFYALTSGADRVNERLHCRSGRTFAACLDHGIAGGIKAPRTAAVLTFSTAMRVAERTHLSLLQCQPSGAMTGMALPGAFAVRTFSMRFRHCWPPSPILGNLILTVCAIKRTPVSLPHSLHPGAAAQACLSFSLEYR